MQFTERKILTNGAGQSELRTDGYVGDKVVLSRSFLADATQDQFFLSADDKEFASDDID